LGGEDEYLKIIDTEVQRCRRIVEGLLELLAPKSGHKAAADITVDASAGTALFR